MKKRTRGRAATCVCKDISVSLFIYSSDALLTHRREMMLHPLRVRRDAGKQPESLDRLEYGHAAAVQGAAAEPARHAQQFGLQREINNLSDPQRRPQQVGRKRQPGKFRHSRRRRVNQSVGRCHRGSQIGSRCGALGTEALAKIGSQVFRADRVQVENRELAGTEGQRRMRNRRTRPAGAKLNHPVPLHIGQSAAETFGKTPPVRVAAEPPSIRQHDGVDRAYGARIVRLVMQ